MPATNPGKGLALFITAAIVTFGCITVMQFLEKPWFFVALAAMHGGIALFAISKRTLKRGGFNLMRHFKRECVLLLPFLLIMLYTFASYAGLVPPWGDAKAPITLVYALVCFAITFWSFRRMQHDVRAQAQSGNSDAPAPARTHAPVPAPESAKTHAPAPASAPARAHAPASASAVPGLAAD